MRTAIFLSAASLLLMSGAVMAKPLATTCAALISESTGKFCTENGVGIAIADNEQRAQLLLKLGEDGQTRFPKAFSKPALRYAIIEIDADGLSQDRVKTLEAAGFPVILPWPSPKEFVSKIEAAVRSSVEAQIAKIGLTGAARDAAIEAAVAKALKETTGVEAEATKTAIAHELGHFWMSLSYWPKAAIDSGGHYGGPAPDWLDEMAAVLMEPDGAKESRKSQFWKRYRDIQIAKQENRDPKDELLTLVQYLTTEHPYLKQLNDKKASQPSVPVSNGTNVKIVVKNKSDDTSNDNIRFYLQSLLFSEYLAARSKNPAIFGIIAKALSQGTRFPDWLSKNGKRYNLPKTLQSTESDWQKWLEIIEPQIANQS